MTVAKSAPQGDKERLQRGIAELTRRRSDGLRLFRSLPHQEKVFTSTASELLIRGGNRSGKTLCTAAEVASAATGIPITTTSGKQIPFKYPTDRPLLIWLIGYGEAHIGDTFHRMLFRRNPEFRMVRDELSGLWRAYFPWEDKHRLSESRMAPPLIPARMIKEWAWKEKSKRFFRICRLKPRKEFTDAPEFGTEIHAFTSKGEPKMGDPVDLIWIDERIMFSKHYSEWQARISDRSGRILWSLWPGNVNAAVRDLIRRAKEGEQTDHDDVNEVRLRFSDNPFIPRDQVEKRLRGWSEKERLSRDEGELVDGTARVYPSFGMVPHGTPTPHEETDDEIDKVLRKTRGVPPPEWRKDLILDPGHAHPGVLFVAIPPPSLCYGGVTHGIVYDEVYLPGSDAGLLIEHVARKRQTSQFQSFIIDLHAGRMTPMGFSITVAEQYSSKMKEFNVNSVETKHYFTWGSDDVTGCISIVRDLMCVMPNGRPRLRYCPGQCPNFAQMIESYVKYQDPHGFVTDKPAPRQIDPLCDCLRYWAGANLQYAHPPKGSNMPSPQYTYFKEVWKKSEGPKDSSIYLGAGEAPNQTPGAIT